MLISYVDKIVDMRRNLVMVEGRVPARAREAVPGAWRSTATRGTSRASIARPGPTASASRRWPRSPTRRSSTGSAARRATTIAPRRSRARRRSCLKPAGVDFAILGQEETCTGDPARRAGNEYLFAMLAEQNAATLNGYKEQGGMKTVVTTCPHCFNTLKNEYPDFGAKLEVVHHTDFLLGLLAEKKLVPKNAVDGQRRLPRQLLPRPLQRRVRVAARDPEAHPGRRARRAGVLDQAARPLLRRRRRADVDGGAEQEPREREAHAPARSTRARRRSPARCPFCMTMLTDGLKSQNLEERSSSSTSRSSSRRRAR